MQYLRARYYNQNQGRFASVDPFEGVLEQPITKHRYIYGNDNPVNYIDPSGKITLSLSESGATSALQSFLASMRIPSIISAAGLFTSALISGVKQRLRSNGVIWEGEILSASLPYLPKAKFASLQSVSSSKVVTGNWVILAYNFIPDLSAGSTLGISTTEVEVIAKPQNPDALPSVWDLASPYVAPKFKITFPLPDGNPFKSSLENPGFFRGWGFGKEKPGAKKVSYEVSFSLGIDQGLSIPITSQYNEYDIVPYLPE